MADTEHTWTPSEDLAVLTTSADIDVVDCLDGFSTSELRCFLVDLLKDRLDVEALRADVAAMLRDEA